MCFVGICMEYLASLIMCVAYGVVGPDRTEYRNVDSIEIALVMQQPTWSGFSSM